MHGLNTIKGVTPLPTIGIFLVSGISSSRFSCFNKKLRQQLRRKSHIKIELCVKLSVLRLFHVGHVVQIKRSSLSLSWH